MVFVEESALERLLKQAARAHTEHRQRTGEPPADWPSWYAAFIIKRLEEIDERD